PITFLDRLLRCAKFRSFHCSLLAPDLASGVVPQERFADQMASLTMLVGDRDLTIGLRLAISLRVAGTQDSRLNQARRRNGNARRRSTPPFHRPVAPASSAGGPSCPAR